MSLKKFIPVSEAEKHLEGLKEKMFDEVVNAIERPYTTADYAVFGYPTQKSMQNDIPNIPHYKRGGKVYVYLSEFNKHVKGL